MEQLQETKTLASKKLWGIERIQDNMAKVTKRMFEEEENSNHEIRINKFLSDSGVCSRREADMHVDKGNVTIDGEVAVMGSKVLPHQTVTFCGKVIERDEKMVLIALNKPQGVVCTTDQREPDNIIDFLKYGKRIYPIGRLDKDSEGLILLTNNGDIVNKILRAGNHHEKEYIVTVNKAMTSAFLKGMSNGVPILDTVTRPCTMEAMDKTTFRIILTQGLNRQIRRMCEYFGYKVTRLQRVRIMNIRLGHLHLGGYRNLTDYELEELKELIQDSYSHPNTDELDDEMVDVRVSDKNIHVKSTKSAASKKKQYKGKNFSANKDKAQDKSHGNTKGKDQKSLKYSQEGNQDKTFKNYKDTVKAASKDASKYGAKDMPKTGFKDTKYGSGSKDAPKYASKDTKYGSKDAPKYGSKDTKYGSGSKDAPKYASKDTKYGSKDAPKTGFKDTKYGSKDAPKTGFKDAKYGSKDTPKTGFKDTKYGSKDAPKTGFKDTKYGSKDAPKFASKDTKYGSKDAPKYASQSTSKHAPKGKAQDLRSVGQGKKEYGNAGQKTKNYRTNRTSR